MKTPQIRLIISIVLLTAVSLYIALPSQLSLNLSNTPLKINHTISKRPLQFQLFGKSIYFNPQLKLGLDLKGGIHLVLDANMDEIDSIDRQDALESVREVISRRIDLFGVAEPVIQTSVNQEANIYRLIVELPGLDNVNQAVSLIGQTAQLEFREQDESLIDPEATPTAMALINSFVGTDLSGSDLKKATVQFDPETGTPVVGLSFTEEGKLKFAQITKRNIGKPVGIFLDGYPETLPIVQAEISDGQAVISGEFNTASAKALAIQLNAGALPVPVTVASERVIGPTLGQDSIDKSIFAGTIGIGMVMLFMVLLYGYLGLLANLGLVVYSIITLALFKLLSVTITLPGLAGFILSVGMAVDANILIFERLKEEVRANRPWQLALERAFGRAWDSIKDANLATLTICFILFNPFNWSFLNTSGLIRGFALTLALGIFTSLFTGIVVTRTLIRLFYKGK